MNAYIVIAGIILLFLIIEGMNQISNSKWKGDSLNKDVD